IGARHPPRRRPIVIPRQSPKRRHKQAPIPRQRRSAFDLEFFRWSLLAIVLLAAAFLVSAASAGSLAAPVNGCAPTIEGKLVVGKTISSSKGCWSNAPTTFAYQWLRCDQKGTNCISIADETSPAYLLASADVGHRMVVLVTASNGSGSTGPVNSKPSAIVSLAGAPQAATRPSITGKAQVGELLLAAPGKYSGGIPTKYAYQWQRCGNAGADCTAASGERGQTYTVRSSDVGSTLRVAVRASNAYGTDTAFSDQTATVTTVPVKVVVTTSMVAARSAVTCCAATRLSGTVSTGNAGELITVLAQPLGELVALPLGTTTSTAGGSWSYSVRPSIQTTYQVKTSTSTGPPLTIGVHPRVGLGYFPGRFFSTKVTGGSGATSFAGKVVLFQRRTASGHWVTLDKVVLDLNSVAKFKVKLPHGVSYMRVYLTPAQAGSGYLFGVSVIRRFTQ
ncbi:MAG: hypothetical protein ACXVY8_07640, partial [Gaiellaceae bacterium]